MTVRYSQVPLLLRMLPGSYSSSIEIPTASSLPVRIVATGANLTVVGPKAAIVADGGANVEVRNLASASEKHVQCGLASTTAATSTVTVRASTFVTIGQGEAFDAQRCTVNVIDTEISLGDYSATVFGARNDTSYVADQVFVRAATNNQIITANASRVQMSISNSVFERTQVVTFLSDNAPPGSSFDFKHVTFAEIGGGSDACSGGTFAYRTMRFENSIITGAGVSDALDSPNAANCTFVNTILNRQSTATLPGTIVADPRFVAPATSDYELQITSPAIDAATPSAVLHDIIGTPRPQGTAPDIGAYERLP